MLGGYINSSLPIYFLELIRHLKLKKAFTEFRHFIKNYSVKYAFMTLIRQSNLGILKKLYYKYSGIDGFFLNKIKKYRDIKDYPNEPKGFHSLLNKHLYKAHTGVLVDLLIYGDATCTNLFLKALFTIYGLSSNRICFFVTLQL